MDRNVSAYVAVVPVEQSLSARRAWIEIKIPRAITDTGLLSLSARRAWIEIFPKVGSIMRAVSRSPQGERG